MTAVFSAPFLGVRSVGGRGFLFIGGSWGGVPPFHEDRASDAEQDPGAEADDSDRVRPGHLGDDEGRGGQDDDGDPAALFGGQKPGDDEKSGDDVCDKLVGDRYNAPLD